MTQTSPALGAGPGDAAALADTSTPAAVAGTPAPDGPAEPSEPAGLQDTVRPATAGTVRRTVPRPAGSRTARVSSVVVALGVVSLLTDISSESVSAVLPLFITSALGMSTLTYGFVDGLMQGASALVRMAGGWASDRGDHPKWVAFAGYGLSALTRAGLLLASGFVAIAALVAVDRLGKGMRTAPRDSMIAASSDPRTLGRSFGVHRTFDTVGAAVGPLVAFVVLWVIPDGYRTVFVISFGCAVLGLAVLGLMVPDLRPRRAAWLERHRAREERGLPKCKGCTCDVSALAPSGRQQFSWRFLTEPGVRRLMLVAGVLALLTVGDGFVYLSLQTRDGFATHWFPLLYVGTNVAYMCLATPMGRLADRVGRAKVFVAAHVALLGAYLCAAVVGGGMASTAATLALLGLFYAGTDGVLSALAGRLAAPAVRGTAIGTAQGVVAGARMCASWAFGLAWFTLGRSPAMLLVAGLLAVAVPVAWRTLRPLDSRLPETARA